MYFIVMAIVFVLSLSIFAAYAVMRAEQKRPLFVTEGYRGEKEHAPGGYVMVGFGLLGASLLWPFTIPGSIVGYTVFSLARSAMKAAAAKKVAANNSGQTTK